MPQTNYIAAHAEHSYPFYILSNPKSSARKHSKVVQKLLFPIIGVERFLWASCHTQFAKAPGTLTKGEFPNLCYNTESSSNILIRRWSLLGSSFIKHCYAQQGCSSVWLGSLQWALFPLCSHHGYQCKIKQKLFPLSLDTYTLQ